MTCLEVVERVTDFMEGHLTLLERLAFRFHLGLCRPCRRYVRQMRLTVRALGAMPPERTDDDVKDKLMDSFRGCCGKQGRSGGS